jgi:hypothetical protein
MKHKRAMDLDRMVINMLMDYHTLKNFPKSGQNSDPFRDLGIKPAQLFSSFFDSTLTVNFYMKKSLKKLLVAMVKKYKSPTLVWTGWQHSTMQTLFKN